MKKISNKIKTTLKHIHWPTLKETTSDTILVLTTTGVLSALIFAWTTGIEIVVNWIVKLF